MNLLLIPIAAFMGIVALLILKEIRPNSAFKKALKVIILLFFIAAFAVIAYYMSAPKGF
jgi:hypothetical protein